MTDITIYQPKKVFLAEGALDELFSELSTEEHLKIFILSDPHLAPVVSAKIKTKNLNVLVAESSGAEPSYKDCVNFIDAARNYQANYIIGVGGGSVLDLAKLVAALVDRDEDISQFAGKGLIGKRNIPLVCVPTTSGAGSEASPNAILIDDSDNSKKGIIDQVLIPDAVYIDPTLIASLPPAITAYTGLDALTHCIEAYANKNAHPVIDTYAMEGIRLISQNLGKVIADGNDLEARSKVALGAYYGGLCLGPVNTAAVHALAYPLGTTYKIAHGLSNALILVSVLEFNLEAAKERYAQIALAMGGQELDSEEKTAKQGFELIRNLIEECGMPSKLSDLNVSESALPQMANDAMKIQRLLVNNVKPVTADDTINIYKKVL